MFLKKWFDFMEAQDDGGGGGDNADVVDDSVDDSGAGGESSDTPAFPTWMDQNKGELKKHEKLKAYPTINDLSKAHLELLEKMAEDKRIEIPKDDAGDDVKKAFWKKIGKPDTYEVPEEVKKNPHFQGIDGVMDRLNLTKSQADGLNEFFKEYLSRENVESEKKRNLSYETFVKTAKSPDNWGADYDANLQYIQRFVNTFGGEPLKQAMRSVGADHQFEIMNAMAKVAKLLGPSYFATGQIQPPKPSKGLTYKSDI